MSNENIVLTIIIILLTLCPLCRLLLVHLAVYMTILVAYFFCTLTGKPQRWLTSYRRNRSNFVFFGRLCYVNIKGSVGLILAKASAMRISIPLDLSSRPFIPLPRFMRSRRVAPLLAPSLVFTPRQFA